jgi:predicted RecB family nuclease
MVSTLVAVTVTTGTARPVALDAAAMTRCRRRVHLDHDPAAASSPRADPDPALEQRQADAQAHRVRIGQQLAADAGPGWIGIASGAPVEQRLADTAAAIESGARYVWNAALPPGAEGTRWASADLLIRTQDGDYLPVIIVRHRITDPGSGALTTPLHELSPERATADETRKVRSHSRDQLRLAHLARLLQSAGWAGQDRPRYGGVIGLDADVMLWCDLAAPSWPGGHSSYDEYDRRFADRLAIARSAAAGGPALAQPSRITECRRCPWWPTCEPLLVARDDVSLVVKGEQAAALRAAGISRIVELAALDPSGDPPVQDTGQPFADVVALARAWRRGLSVVRRVPRVDVARADVEVDIDLESFGEAGAYLWGTMLSTRNGLRIGETPGYRAFATWCPLPTLDEGRAFAAFWTWLRHVRRDADRRGLSFAAYCYNAQAENRWLLSSAERFAGLPGVPTHAEVTEFVEHPGWVDLYAVVSEWFLCAHGKGLKRIAPVAGFAWRDPEAGGENSMRWYRDAVGMDGAPPQHAQRLRLLDYNADDVAATLALRRWMNSPAVESIPLADDL